VRFIREKERARDGNVWEDMEEGGGFIRFSHFSMSEMQAWNSRMWRRRLFALRAASTGSVEDRVPSDAAWVLA